MTTLPHPALWGALIFGLLLVAAFAVSATSDSLRIRTDRCDGVVASFAGLRLTASHLIVGQSKDAERIPLAGLSVGVKQTESAGGADVVVTVRGAGQMIERREPLSYGAGAEAQTFAIMFSRARLAMQPVAQAAAAAAA